MKLFKSIKAAAVGAVLSIASAGAMAETMQSNDAFKGFSDTIQGWTNGGLGVGLATTMLLMGGAIGVAKNSPMPALAGIAGGAFFNWGPGIIQTLVLRGALI
jgi:conjugal transfer pilus assembly protein TraA